MSVITHLRRLGFLMGMLFSPLVASGLVGPVAAQELKKSDASNSVQSLFGVWSGKASEPGSAETQHYEMWLTIFEKDGRVQATAKYPALNCSALGEFISAGDNQIFRFHERVDVGRDKCIDGPFELTVLGPLTIHWNWGNGQATSTLTRASD